MELPSWARKNIAGVPAWVWALAILAMVSVTLWLRKRNARDLSGEVEESEEGSYYEDPTYTLPGGSDGAGGGDVGPDYGESILGGVEGLGWQLEGISEQLGQLIPRGDIGDGTDTPSQLPPEVEKNMQRVARLTGRIREASRERQRDRSQLEDTRARLAEVKRGGVKGKRERRRVRTLRDTQREQRRELQQDRKHIGTLKQKRAVAAGTSSAPRVQNVRAQRATATRARAVPSIHRTRRAARR